MSETARKLTVDEIINRGGDIETFGHLFQGPEAKKRMAEYAKRDPQFLDKLQRVLDDMVEINGTVEAHGREVQSALESSEAAESIQLQTVLRQHLETQRPQLPSVEALIDLLRIFARHNTEVLKKPVNLTLGKPTNAKMPLDMPDGLVTIFKFGDIEYAVTANVYGGHGGEIQIHKKIADKWVIYP